MFNVLTTFIFFNPVCIPRFFSFTDRLSHILTFRFYLLCRNLWMAASFCIITMTVCEGQMHIFSLLNGKHCGEKIKVSQYHIIVFLTNFAHKTIISHYCEIHISEATSHHATLFLHSCVDMTWPQEYGTWCRMISCELENKVPRVAIRDVTPRKWCPLLCDIRWPQEHVSHHRVAWVKLINLSLF